MDLSDDRFWDGLQDLTAERDAVDDLGVFGHYVLRDAFVQLAQRATGKMKEQDEPS
jgi:hypothetical protein